MAVLKYWDETLSQWLPVAPGPKGDKGDKGDTGDLANLDIGTVTTGSPAAAHIDGNFEDGYELDLTLPSVGAGSIHDADVNDDANIGRTKIAGTALTDRIYRGVLGAGLRGGRAPTLLPTLPRSSRAITAAGMHRWWCSYRWAYTRWPHR